MKKEELLKGEDYVECEKCGHVISKKRAQIVKFNGGSGTMFGFETIRCELHKLPYDRSRTILGVMEYWKELEVDKDGTPIGYKKITTK